MENELLQRRAARRIPAVERNYSVLIAAGLRPPLAMTTRTAGLRRAAHLAFLPLLLILPACQQQMASQPSLRPDEPSSFFADGRAARPVVPGTVPRGLLQTDLPLYTGLHHRETGAWATPVANVGAVGNPLVALALEYARQKNLVEEFPFPITEKVLRHGQNRYLVYCVVCHDVLGTGKGIIVQRGYSAPPSYHIERLRKSPPGHFFQVMTLGYGSMPSYAAQIPPRDRWAIAAYVVALQKSQHFEIDQLTPEMRQAWKNQSKVKAGGPAP
jgi:mono/diheme cytochrome c family protein